MNTEKKGKAPGAHGDAGTVNRTNFSRYFLLLLFVVTLVIFLILIRVFLVPIVLAAVFATLFYPLYERLLKAFKGRTGVSALVSCIVLLVGLLIPVLVVANLVVFQGIELYQTVSPAVQQMIEEGDEGLLGRLNRSSLMQWIRVSEINWKGALQQGLQELGGTIAVIINRASQATFRAIISMFVLLFTLFYFFKDGKRFIQSIKRVIPLSERYKEEIFKRFGSISRATVKGTLVIGLIQGSLGAVTLLMFGFSAWLLWGVLMVLLSIIPLVGPGLVLVPAGIFQIATGKIWQGLVIIGINFAVVSTVDNILRPRLVGRDAGMHDLLIFFSTLGGLSVFGVMGFIIGPIIAALFLTVMDIYSIEFRRQLEASHGNGAGEVLTQHSVRDKGPDDRQPAP